MEIEKYGEKLGTDKETCRETDGRQEESFAMSTQKENRKGDRAKATSRRSQGEKHGNRWKTRRTLRPKSAQREEQH